MKVSPSRGTVGAKAQRDEGGWTLTRSPHATKKKGVVMFILCALFPPTLFARD